MKKYVILGVLALATLAYAGGYHLHNKGSMTNTMAASGASSAITKTLDGINMIDRSSLTGTVIVNASAVTARGYGLTDTCTIVIKTDGVSADSTWKAGLPCTSFVAITAAIGDTLFKSDASIYVRIADSSADSAFTADHTVVWNLVAR